MKINYVKADPAGNVTLFVLNSLRQEERKRVNTFLLSLDKEAEQAGCLSWHGNNISVQMMGGEFCGNATRSAAAYCAWRDGLAEGHFAVSCSGCPDSLPVTVKKIAGAVYDAEVILPLPLSITKEKLPMGKEYIPLIRVVLPGIEHYIYLTDALDSLDKNSCWTTLENHVLSGFPPEAFGLILLEERSCRMIPAVFVTATRTLYWEHSCGSGSAAAAAALATLYKKDIAMKLREPGGTITVKAAYRSEGLQQIRIGGPVALQYEKQVEMADNPA
jgi:diaminopimelate epimerase